MEMNNSKAAGGFPRSSFTFSLQLDLRFHLHALMLGNSLLIETVEQILKLMLDAAAVLQQIAFQLCKPVFVEIQNDFFVSHDRSPPR